MLKNAPFLITIGVDTAENEPRKGWSVVARTGVSILRALRGPAEAERAAAERQAAERKAAELSWPHARQSSPTFTFLANF